jgi:transcriptional regulator with XRE-family HTH domain
MPKQTYVPTEADRLTGQNVRNLRRLHSETLIETLERSGLQLGQSSLSRIELGERPLSLPEATKLAAHWNTIPAKIIVKPAEDTPPTEQEWLGNKPTQLFPMVELTEAEKNAVSAYTVSTISPALRSPERALTIDLDAPLTPEQYRDQVWVPYLEARYSADLKAS